VLCGENNCQVTDDQYNDGLPSAANTFPSGMTWRFLVAYGALYLPFAVYTPYLQVLLRLRGCSRQDIGVVQGTLDVMAVLAPPLWGYLSDRIQRPRLVILIGVLLTGGYILVRSNRNEPRYDKVG